MTGPEAPAPDPAGSRALPEPRAVPETVEPSETAEAPETAEPPVPGEDDVLPDDPPPDPPPPVPVRIAGCIGLLLLGLVVGVLGAFVQADRLLVGAVAVPWGAVLVLVTLVLCVRGASWAVLTRWGGWAFFAGWLAATVALAVDSPSGDLALSGGVRQTVYLLGGVVVGAAAASIPLVERRAETGVRVPS